jgi:restriction system protein
MARRGSLIGVINAIAREQARAARQAEMDRRRAEIDRRRLEQAQARAEREELKRQAEQEKEAKRRYLESREQEVVEMNRDLAVQGAELKLILERTLSIDDTISFESLRIREEYPPLSIPHDLAIPIRRPEKQEVPYPGFFDRLIPGWRKWYERRVQKADQEYEEKLRNYHLRESQRERKIEELEEEYEHGRQAFIQKTQQRNAEIDELESAYQEGDAQAVITYNSMVLERSVYPEGFPQKFRLSYLPDSKELVIDYELPSLEVIPSIAEFRYIKSRDAIDSKKRKPAEIKEDYEDVVASVALRTVHEVFEADQQGHLQVVVFSGFVSAVDPATGKDAHPYLISVRTTRESFGEINLARIDKRACLRNLGAQVSSRPDEMLPVKPIVEFDMVDKRFVEQSDVLSGLDSRPNLMELNPFEFEALVSNLFGKMGLEAKLTRSSRDGGVDAVAFDTRPIVGGKIVIQAKRYKNTVEVSAVRDLYGTMMNEGANKGILVTTSSYGPDAYEFVKDKPIELIDGGGLLYLLDQAGIKARIVFSNE